MEKVLLSNGRWAIEDNGKMLKSRFHFESQADEYIELHSQPSDHRNYLASVNSSDYSGELERYLRERDRRHVNSVDLGREVRSD